MGQARHMAVAEGKKPREGRREDCLRRPNCDLALFIQKRCLISYCTCLVFIPRAFCGLDLNFYASELKMGICYIVRPL